MKTAYCVFLVILLLLCSGCTLNFKAKELQIDTEPPLSYELATVELLVQS